MRHLRTRARPAGLSGWVLTAVTLGLAVGLTRGSIAPAYAGAAAAHPGASVEARLRAVEDYQAIQQLLAAYMTAMDTSNWTAYSQLFAADGELMFQTIDEKGPSAIRERMSRSIRRPAAKSGAAAVASLLHTLSNIDIHIDGDHATDTARWTVMSRGPDGRPRLGATGHYVDTLVRTSDGWKFRRRVIYADFPFDDPIADRAKAAAK